MTVGLLPKRSILVAHRGKLGLLAWAHGLVVVLFEFLDDDTKLAQSCTDWLHVQRWHTVVPELPTTGWRRLRADGDGAFRDAVEEAAALHSHDELFAKHIVPEPAPEDPVDWAMAEATDGEDDAPMPDAPPEPELIDMPPAPVSAPRMSNLERCIALRLVYGAGPR